MSHGVVGPHEPEAGVAEDWFSGGETGVPAEVGLDDLFWQTGTQSVLRVDTRSQLSRWLLGRVFLAVSGAAVIYGLLYFVRLTIPFALLLVFILVVAWLRESLRAVAAGPLPVQVTGRGIRLLGQDPGVTGPTLLGDHDGVAVAVDRWAGRLAMSGSGSGRLVIKTVLGDLVDERLRLRHGFTRASDPDRAREMMGESLWRMLQNPSAGGHIPRDMAALVQRIEEL